MQCQLSYFHDDQVKMHVYKILQTPSKRRGDVDKTAGKQAGIHDGVFYYSLALGWGISMGFDRFNSLQ
jgi:hypothetical protein